MLSHGFATGPLRGHSRGLSLSGHDGSCNVDYAAATKTRALRTGQGGSRRVSCLAGRMRSMLQFPAPLRRGDRVGVTSPSAGVEGPGVDRIDFCVGWLRKAGFDVVVGE